MTLEDLQKSLAALPDERDVPNTLRAQDELAEKKQMLSRRINVARMAASMLSECSPQIDGLTKQLTVLTAVREELASELLACPSRSIDRAEVERIQGLKVSILSIDGRFNLQTEAYPTNLPLVAKLQSHGYPASLAQPMAGVYGSVPTIEQRLAGLQKRRDEAQAVLDSVLREEAVSV